MKWTEYPPDVLPAWVAEMDFSLPGPVKDAVRAALDRGDCGYPNAVGLGEAYAAFTRPRFGWEPAPGQVFAIPDVMTGVAEVLQEITPHGSAVVINPPVYPPFSFRLEMAGHRIETAPLRRDEAGRYHLDLAVVDAALARDGVAAYLLCSPHNPAGRVWSRDDLAGVAEVCARRGVALLVDEIHAPLALPGAQHIPFLSLDLPTDLARRTFTFTSASKGWNIPGLKCGVAVTGTAEAAAVLALRWEGLLASHLGVLATEAAFRDGADWLNAALAQLDENRTLLGTLLAQHLPTVGYRPPEASFLAWLDCRALGFADPAARFLEAGRIAVTSGSEFGAGGEGFVRLNIGTSPELVTEMVHRLARAAGPDGPISADDAQGVLFKTRDEL